jgi:MSHA pilin protein MshD
MAFIAIVGIATAGLLLVYRQAVVGSADPLLRKQALAAAESLLNEVLMQPFTWCDPQDPAQDAATPPFSSAACTGGAAGSQDKGGGALGPQPASEARVSMTDPFDNVSDYHGFQMTGGLSGLDGVAVPALAAYSASVTVQRDGGTFGLPADAVLRVDVSVSGRGQAITLTGWRFRHSPNAAG